MSVFRQLFWCRIPRCGTLFGDFTRLNRGNLVVSKKSRQISGNASEICRDNFKSSTEKTGQVRKRRIPLFLRCRIPYGTGKTHCDLPARDLPAKGGRWGARPLLGGRSLAEKGGVYCSCAFCKGDGASVFLFLIEEHGLLLGRGTGLLPVACGRSRRICFHRLRFSGILLFHCLP